MRALTATVVRNEPLVRSLMRLTLAAGPLASALPGQCVAVSRPSALSIVAHPFPLASLDMRAGSAAPALPPPLLPWADALYAALPAGAYLTLRDLVYRQRLRLHHGFATVV